MRHSRLVWIALALWAVAGTTTLALAGDTAKDAKTSAISASATCTAAMAAKCTPEMAAACQAHGASAAAMAQCSAEMAAACKAKGASAASMSQCSMKGAKAASASTSGCSMAGAAVTADAKASPHGAVSATIAGAGATCGMKSARTAGNSADCSKGAAATAGNASKSLCSGEGLANLAGSGAHADCDACGDMVKCAEEISAAGGRAQMVPLKNGMMFVYTAESAAGIRAIKQAVSERSQRLATYSSAGGGTHLCPQCKAMRGAVASGKLTREVVSIEGGCLTLMTSNDPTIIAQLHAMSGMTAARTKS